MDKIEAAVLKTYIESQTNGISNITEIMRSCAVGTSLSMVMRELGYLEKATPQNGLGRWTWLKGKPTDVDIQKIRKGYKQHNHNLVEKYGLLNKKEPGNGANQNPDPKDVVFISAKALDDILTRLRTVEDMLLELIATNGEKNEDDGEKK